MGYSAERRKVNVLEIVFEKFSWSVSTDRVRNEELRRRTGIER